MLVNSNQNAHLMSQTNGVKEVGQTADDYNQQRRSSASSGISSQSEAGISFCRKSHERDFLHRVNDLRKRSFREFFFHALPLVVQPIIVVRLICHKVFGNMLQRKIATPPPAPPTPNTSPYPPHKSPMTSFRSNQHRPT